MMDSQVKQANIENEKTIRTLVSDMSVDDFVLLVSLFMNQQDFDRVDIRTNYTNGKNDQFIVLRVNEFGKEE